MISGNGNSDRHDHRSGSSGSGAGGGGSSSSNHGGAGRRGRFNGRALDGQARSNGRIHSRINGGSDGTANGCANGRARARANGHGGTNGNGSGNGHGRGGQRILITGGAGFIGSHLADALLKRGYRVRALDILCPQVHGPDRRRPEYLSEDVELIVGDVRDPDAVKSALRDVDAVYHLAAAVGVGQSMYEIAHYTSVNNLGTAVLLEALIANPVRRLIVASSMSIYGEGLYKDPEGNLSRGLERTAEQLRDHDWEIRNNRAAVLTPVPTPEDKPPALASVYALSKYDQERMCLMVGRAYGIPTVAMRFFNAYGPRQALGNPYTGVLAIFASRLMKDQPPLIFEDGRQRRDFVSVHDLAEACCLALEVPEAAGKVFNIASGKSSTVLEVAEQVARVLGKPHLAPEVTGKYRVGDIRHCFADIRLARRVLGYQPRVSMGAGLLELAEWLETQEMTGQAPDPRRELDARGLAI